MRILLAVLLNLPFHGDETYERNVTLPVTTSDDTTLARTSDYFRHTFLPMASLKFRPTWSSAPSCSAPTTRSTPRRQLFTNPDFQEPLAGECWVGVDCQLGRMEDIGQDGTLRWSGKVTERSGKSGSVSQSVLDLTGEMSYYFTAWIKVLTPGTFKLSCMAEVGLKDGSTTTVNFATAPYMRPERGWTQVGGDFTLSPDGVSARVYVQFGDVTVTYLISQTSLTQVPVDPDWQQKAQDRIEKIRKQDVKIKVDCGPHAPDDVQVDVTLARHAFAFGSAIQAARINGDSASDRRYQEVFYDNFEWAVFENSMKWYLMERKQYKMDFEQIDTALVKLKEKNITVRGHCILWDFESKSPTWLKPMTGAEVLEQVQRRCTYMLDRYSADVQYWDVNNEQLHGGYFEAKSGQMDVTSWVFKQAHNQAPVTKLMINDYGIVSSGRSTVALVSSARELLASGAPLQAVGMQSHFGGHVDPHILNRRLDMLAEAGLPLWTTELDISIADEEAKARAYEIALTVLFSRPEVDGLLVWGFWDQAHWRPEAAMWTGPDIQPNAAGRKWMELVKGAWRTHELLQPATSRDNFQIRAFQGEYDVTIRVKGQQVGEVQRFMINKGKDASWTILVQRDGWVVDEDEDKQSRNVLDKCFGGMCNKKCGFK